jgi:hypothetical protein
LFQKKICFTADAAKSSILNCLNSKEEYFSSKKKLFLKVYFLTACQRFTHISQFKKLNENLF